jgi:hypothetical protein
MSPFSLLVGDSRSNHIELGLTDKGMILDCFVGFVHSFVLDFFPSGT